MAWQACGRWEFVSCEIVHNVTFDALAIKGTKPVVFSFHRVSHEDKFQLLSRSTARRESCASGTNLIGVELVPLNTGRITSQHPHGKPTLIKGQERLYRPPAARGLQEGRRFDIGASTAGPTPPPERSNCHPRRASTIRQQQDAC